MPPVDPRHWNLLCSTLLVAVACDPNEPANTTSADSGGSSTDDADTGLGYECISESQCPPDEACISQYCRSYSIFDECELPLLVEIPLPPLPDFEDAAFADVDGDADDELLLLRNDGIAVLQDDDSVISTTWPMPLPNPQMVPLALDDDDHIDLVVFSVAGEAVVALGDGAGGFMIVGSIVDLPQVVSAVAIDVDLDGLDEAVVRDQLTFEAHLLDDLLGLSNVSVVLDDAGLGSASGLGVVRADADAVMLDGVCQALLLHGPDLSESEFLSDPVSPHGHCAWGAAAFADGEPERPFALMDMTPGPMVPGWLQRWQLPDATYEYLALPKPYTRVAVLGPTPSASASLLLSAPFEPAAMIWDWADDGSACYALLPVESLGLRFAAGQRSAGTRTFLSYGDDVQLWSLDP